MTSAKPSNDFLSYEAVEEVSKILRDFKSPDAMLVSAANWLSTNLYDQYSQRDPQAAPYQIIKMLFTDTLLELEEENQEYADILRNRFWKGLTAKEIALNSPWSERTYFSLQNKAIKLFTFLLLQREQASSSHPSTNQAAEGDTTAVQIVSHTTEDKNVSFRSGHLIYGSVILFLGISFLVIFFLFSKTNLPFKAAMSGHDLDSNGQAVVVDESINPSKGLTNTPEVPKSGAFCGEIERLIAPPSNRFNRSEGVSLFTAENTGGAVLSNTIRTLSNSAAGLWIGYFSNADQKGGAGSYDKNSWAECRGYVYGEGENVNVILIDKEDRVWVGFERHGLAMFDGKSWVHFTIDDGLPSDSIYGITIDEAGAVWVGTWEGVAKYEGGDWTVPYTVKNDTIYNDRVHAIAFDSQNDIWVGHITGGVSHYQHSTGRWIHYTAERTELGGNYIRQIIVKPETPNQPESVWFATSDGGISSYESDTWTSYGINEGLPSTDVRALALDRYNRVWAATGAGVVYLGDSGWVRYNSLDTSSISIGTNCLDCVFDDDVVWTGTTENGLTHSRLPLPEPVLDVDSICFVDHLRERICPELTAEEINDELVVTAEYPNPLRDGDTLRFEITVMTRSPYQLRDNRGDFLSNTDSDDFHLFGAWPVIAVDDVIEPGQPYTFTDYDNPFFSPPISDELNEETFTSTWRVWMHTRYAGPYIRLVFKVVN